MDIQYRSEINESVPCVQGNAKMSSGSICWNEFACSAKLRKDIWLHVSRPTTPGLKTNFEKKERYVGIHAKGIASCALNTHTAFFTWENFT